MAWTTPPTFVSSTTATAADANILSADLAYLKLLSEAAAYMAVKVERVANQSIPDDTDVAVSWDTQIFDLGGAWSSGTDIVIPAGWVPAGVSGIAIRATGHVAFAGDTDGTRTLTFMVNGTLFTTVVLPAGPDYMYMFNTDVAPDCVAGDIITAAVHQDSGGALNMTGVFLVERAGTTS